MQHAADMRGPVALIPAHAIAAMCKVKYRPRGSELLASCCKQHLQPYIFCRAHDGNVAENGHW